MKLDQSRKDFAPSLVDFKEKVLPNHRKYFLNENMNASELDFLKSMLEIYRIDLSDYIRVKGIDAFDDEVYKNKRIIEFLEYSIRSCMVNENAEMTRKKDSREYIQSDTIGQKKVITIEEAALYSGFSKSFLYKCTSKKLLEFSKPNGKTIFIDREVFENWLLSRKSTNNEQIERAALSYCTLTNGKGGSYGK